MFRSIFRPYGPVWNFCNTITDVLLLSLLWCACSLPLVTLGAATTALYDAAVHGIRYREPGPYRRFFRTFRAEWKTSVPVTLLWGVILLFGFYVLALLEEAAVEQTVAGVMAGGYRVLMGIPLCAACWSCMLLSRFTYKFRELTANALRFLPVHLLPSLAIGVFTWLVCWYCLHYPIALAFAPAVAMIGWSLVAEPVFKKYGGGLGEDAPSADPEKER